MEVVSQFQVALGVNLSALCGSAVNGGAKDSPPTHRGR